MRCFSRPKLLAIPVAGVAVLVSVCGCWSRPATVGSGTAVRAENPWPRVDAQLRKDGSLASARGVLAQLNTELALNSDPQYQPAGLTPEAEAILHRTAKLTDEELKELRANSFTNLDPNYLAECLYLRDAARSLDAAGLPPVKQAELAFAWVCRQLVLSHWVTASGRGAQRMPPVPPSYALRRGSGSGLERAFVFLALLQQLGLDGCLIGPPEAETRGWSTTTDPARPPKGPFWAVGVRAGGDVILFDPWRGEQLPGALAALKANPDVMKPWIEDKGRPWDVTAEQLKAATLFVATPLTALAPRMRRLEQELQAAGAPRLAVDPVALMSRFATEAKEPGTKFWNPAGDPFTVTRLLNSFLPPSEGGATRDETVYNLYRNGALPADLLNLVLVEQVPDSSAAVRFVPARLRGPFAPLLPSPTDPAGVLQAITRVANAAIGHFAQSFLVSPTPREQIQRGQFAEVSRSLVETRKRFDDAHQRVQSDRHREQAITAWAERAKAVYAQLADSRSARDPVAVADAEARIELLWRSDQGVAGALVDLVVADPGRAEATYLLASCMHEQAERTQAQYDRLAADPRQAAASADVRQKAADLWEEAKAQWAQYQRYAAAQAESFPGRAEHANWLAERAALQFARVRGR